MLTEAKDWWEKHAGQYQRQSQIPERYARWPPRLGIPPAFAANALRNHSPVRDQRSRTCSGFRGGCPSPS